MPIPSDEDMKRISRTVTYVERLQRSAPVAPSQQQFVAPIVQLIRVTGDAAVSGRYPAIVQDYDAATDTWSDLTDADCYAIDPAGTALTEGTYLARRWGEYNSLPVFTRSEEGLAIAEVDGSPSYSRITTLTVDSADGLELSQPGSGQARIDIVPATASQNGVVSTGVQTFGGQKVFSDGALFIGFTTHRSKTVTWSTDQTDYAIGDGARVLYVDATANVILNSILFSGAGTTPDSGGEANARFLIIVNTNATYSLTLKHQASTGTAAERFYCDGAADIVLTYRQAAYGWYDPNLERHVWFKLSGAGSGSVPAATTAGTLLISDGSSWLEKFAITNGEGYIVTNEEGLIVASGV